MSFGFSPLTVIDGPVNVSPTDDTVCLHYEAYPELSLNSPGNLFVHYYRAANPQAAYFNWAPSYNAWKTAIQAAPPAAGFCLAGDPWATTSGYSGLDYVSSIEHTFSNGVCQDSTFGFGIGIAATQDSEFGDPATTWDFPEAYANEPSSIAGDGPMMYFDPGGTALWIAATGNMGEFALYVFPNCQGKSGHRG